MIQSSFYGSWMPNHASSSCVASSNEFIMDPTHDAMIQTSGSSGPLWPAVALGLSCWPPFSPSNCWWNLGGIPIALAPTFFRMPLVRLRHHCRDDLGSEKWRIKIGRLVGGCQMPQMPMFPCSLNPLVTFQSKDIPFFSGTCGSLVCGHCSICSEGRHSRKCLSMS